MALHTLALLSALVFSLASDPQAALHGEAGATAAQPGLIAPHASPAAAPVAPLPGYPAPGTCVTDNSDPVYTCTTCTRSDGSVVITCKPKSKPQGFFFF